MNRKSDSTIVRNKLTFDDNEPQLIVLIEMIYRMHLSSLLSLTGKANRFWRQKMPKFLNLLKCFEWFLNDNLLPGTEYFKITLFRQLQEKMCVTRIAPAEGVKIPHYMELSKISQMDQYN